MGSIRLSYSYVVKDRYGKTVDMVKDKRANSFLPRFLELLNGELSMIYAGTVSAVEQPVIAIEKTISDWTAGAKQTPAISVGYPLAYISAAATAGDHSYGILIGSGTLANTKNTYDLTAKYPHGDGVGYFNYGDTTFSVYTATSEPTQAISISRTFVNNSTQSQSIIEVGLAVKKAYYDTDTGTTRAATILIIRDVLATPVSVPAAGSVAWTYRIKITVS